MAKKNKVNTYDFYLPYHKQGDDLSYALEHNDNDIARACNTVAHSLRGAVDYLERLAKFSQSHELEIDADCHCIMVHCTEEVGNLMIKEGFPVQLQDYFDDEDDEFVDSE